MFSEIFFSEKVFRDLTNIIGQIQECEQEKDQLQKMQGIKVTRIGFVCAGGFDFESKTEFHLIDGEALYRWSEADMNAIHHITIILNAEDLCKIRPENPGVENSEKIVKR